jgi:hypothetical protein
LPAGVDDDVNHCEGAGTCAVGACTTSTLDGAMLGHFGDPCTTDAGCFNSVCQAGLCKLALGDPCLYDVTCGSGLCANHVCAACATDTDCPLAHCNATDAGATGNVCGLGGGDPCAAGTDCAGGLCDSSKFCAPSGSQSCTPASCITHACPGGVCATCTSSADCPLNTACTGGNCLAPPGAYCTLAGAAECASGVCPPPAFLDFRRCM